MKVTWWQDPLLQQFESECVDHPLYSLNSAPNGCYLFGPLKKHLGGQCFQNVMKVQVQEAVIQWYHFLSSEFNGEAI